MLPLFVYGTLLQGQVQAALLEGCPRTEATVRGTLYRLPAGYPALSLRGNGVVHGELVTLRNEGQLRVIDHYEGVEELLFQRVQVDVVIGLRRLPAWAYVMDDPRLRGGREVPDGRWRAVRRR